MEIQAKKEAINATTKEKPPKGTMFKEYIGGFLETWSLWMSRKYDISRICWLNSSNMIREFESMSSGGEYYPDEVQGEV